MEQLLFIIFALATCGGALGVVLSQNVVRMAFWLVISLGATSGLFFLLNADFIGATQLLIYVGGTVVLLIFGVMLTSSSPFSPMKTSLPELLQGGFIGVALFGVLSTSILAVNWDQNNQRLREAEAPVNEMAYNPAEAGNTARPLGAALLGARFDRDLRTQPTGSPATLSPGYLLVFEIISVHLLVVLIGAAYLARAKQIARTKSSGEADSSSEATYHVA